MFKSFSYKVSRLFWSIYFALTIFIIGVSCGYFLTLSVYLVAFLLSPWPNLSERVRHLAEDIQCLSIRLLLRIQPWLRCETNFPHILGFYRTFSTRRIVFVANHRSNFDTFLLISFIPGLRGLAKSSLFYNVFFAPFMFAAGFVPVDKNSAQSFFSGLKKVKNQILDQNRSVLVFPENTRCEKGFTSINKFSGAFFSLAMESNALIVPIVIESTDQILARGDILLNPSRPVKVKMLAPVSANQFKDFMELRDSVWGQMKVALS